MKFDLEPTRSQACSNDHYVCVMEFDHYQSTELVWPGSSLTEYDVSAKSLSNSGSRHNHRLKELISVLEPLLFTRTVPTSIVK